jgi:hypothetical protein
MRHEFFDKVLTNKETVDYVIDHLAAANFDPEFFTSYEKKFRNNLLTNSLVQKQYNMSKSIDNISIASHENIEMDGIQKLGITLGLLGLFIMTLALFNVSFPNKVLVSRIYSIHFHGYCSIR